MIRKLIVFTLLGTLIMTGCVNNNTNNQLSIEHYADTLSVVRIEKATQYLLLPIEENSPECPLRLNTGNNTDTWMDIRLAIDSIDYYVPLRLPQGNNVCVEIKNISTKAITFSSFQLSDTFSVDNTEYYRPIYHHTPQYGWMNDPNGLTYKDGEYHLYYQYNPYGSKWGNMHWGHSVSTDLIHWQHLEPAISRDNFGQIFSGSAVVASVDNDTDPFDADVVLPGTGGENDFIAAYYTSDNWRMPDELLEQQSYAISVDNGRTFRKYGAPVLQSDGRKDFRDPKIFWFAPKQKWYMIVSANNVMQFYSSVNLRNWTFVSEWGDEWGVSPRLFECPDFFQLSIGDSEKWIMIVNVNPGCQFGGSATEYFVGDFDGEQFVCNSSQKTVKWLDWGKDHYAAVTFSNEPHERVIALPWMSNWQYANELPTKQFRSANGLPRQLFLYSVDNSNELYVGAHPVADALKLSSPTDSIPTIGNEAMLIKFDIEPNGNIELYNDNNEKLVLTTCNNNIYMNRNASGIICSEPFAQETWAPLQELCGKNKKYHIELWIDKCSAEMFVDEGKIAMTNLIFPRSPYNKFKGEGISNVTFQTISL